MIVLMSVSPARMKSSRNAVASATIASMIGMNIATNVRKTMSSTMIAASRPSSSDVPCSIGGNSASPLYSTVIAGRLDSLPDRVLDGDDGLAILVVDDPVELRLRVRDAAVLGEGVLAERVGDALEAGLVLGRLELRRAEPRDRLLDRGLPLGRVKPLAVRRSEDDVEHAPLLRGELGLDQVGRVLRLRARDLEFVTQAAADRGDEPDQDDDDPEPAQQDAPRVGRARAGPASECAGGEPFVGGAPAVGGNGRVLGHGVSAPMFGSALSA